ncbi:hypothetical protein QZJ86_15950 [Methylomonas montana]|uniref:hypothetical protein n=1 Tax=Methylomonas montana TaxID=3058963 RepID=UPI0026594E58|nr:hypothetical protein [Methylomonas montana]WKJ89500.1 hypothetical protein QZJ86_15950 [Methylomonas montana]
MMFKKLLLIPIVLWVLSGCSSQPAQPLQIQVLQQLPALAAEFETTVETDGHGDEPARSYRWRFWRAADYVETHNLHDDSGEIWSKSAGTVAYQQVFHNQRQVIDYLPGDLKAIGAEPDWRAISTLLNQATIAPLLADRREEALGRPALLYKSRSPDDVMEVSWLAREQLPALIKRSEHGHTLTTRIVALYPLAQSPWPYRRSGDYAYTDFADIGDKENDAFIKSILPKIKGGQSHRH